MPEYLKYRCCICPNSSKPFGSRLYKALCPPNSISKKPETPCRFVKDYIDKFGNVYTVLGDDKRRYRIREKPHGRSRWLAFGTAAYQYFDDAQSELNTLAQEKRWDEYTKEKAAGVGSTSD